MDEKNIKMEKRLLLMVRRAVDYRKSERDKEYINNEAHMEGMQWELAAVDSESPFVVKSDINHLKNTVQIRLGSLLSSSYIGSLKPLSEEDIENVEALEIAYKNEWNRLKMDAIVEKMIKSAMVFDLGYLEFTYNPDEIIGGSNTRREGAINCQHIATANIYLDPSANNVENCNYIVKRESITKEWIELNKPEWLETLKNLNIEAGASITNDNGGIFVARDYTTNINNVYNLDTIYEKVVITIDHPVNDENGKPILKDEEQVVEKIRRIKIKIHYLLNNHYMETNEDYPIDDFPIIPLVWEEIPHSPYGIPLLRGLTIPQKIANLIESASNNIVMHYTVPTWLVSDESGLDVDEVAELINAIGVVWKVSNIESAIRQLEPPKLDDSVVSMGQAFVNYIREYGGANQAYQGNVGTIGATAEGAATAINRATLIDNEPLSQITKAIEHITRVLIKFMTHYYKGYSVTVREEKDNKFVFNNIEMKDDYELLNYDYSIDLVSRSKSDKDRRYNIMKDIYQMQLQYKDQKAIINVSDLVKAAQLDNYNEMYQRINNLTDETLEEKATLIVELMNIAQTKKPDGTPLIDANLLQQGLVDVLNDDNSLEIVESIIQQYQEYESAITDLKNEQMMNQQGSAQNMTMQ